MVAAIIRSADLGFLLNFSLGFVGFGGELGVAFLVAQEPNRHVQTGCLLLHQAGTRLN
jgi:hypothetical protein